MDHHSMQHRLRSLRRRAGAADGTFDRSGGDSIFGNLAGHADGERRGLDRIGG